MKFFFLYQGPIGPQGPQGEVGEKGDRGEVSIKSSVLIFYHILLCS